MNTKIIIGILALVVVVALVFFFKPQGTPPVTTTTTTVPSVTTTVPSVPGESQAYNAIDQELGSAVQGISNSDVQSAMTS